MARISTFVGRDEELEVAIGSAEDGTQQLLENLSPAEIVSIQAQTLIRKHEDGTFNNIRYIHIITVVYD